MGIKKYINPGGVGSGFIDLNGLMEDDPEKIKTSIGTLAFSLYLIPGNERYPSLIAPDNIIASARFQLTATSYFIDDATGTPESALARKRMKKHGISLTKGDSVCYERGSGMLGSKSGKLSRAEAEDVLIDINNSVSALARRMDIPYLTMVPSSYVGRLNGSKKKLRKEKHRNWGDFFNDPDVKVTHLIIR